MLDPLVRNFAFSYAPGKIILVGEHAVLYGAKAIAMPLDQGIRVAVSQKGLKDSGGPLIKGVGPFFMGETFLNRQKKGPKVLELALEYLTRVFKAYNENVAIIIDGSLPPGCGLGSSAALSVALIRATYRFMGESLGDETLHEHVLALETIFHGRPSGIDHTVVIDGRTIAYRLFGEKAQANPIAIARELSLVVVISGPHNGTKNAVQSLSERMRRQNSAYRRIFTDLDHIASEMEQALITGQLSSVGELMNIAQGYLNALSLSTEHIEKLCVIAREHGALGAKLTGAGGGGAVIALCEGHEQAVLNAYRSMGYQSFIATVPKEPIVSTLIDTKTPVS